MVLSYPEVIPEEHALPGMLVHVFRNVLLGLVYTMSLTLGKETSQVSRCFPRWGREGPTEFSLEWDLLTGSFLSEDHC